MDRTKILSMLWKDTMKVERYTQKEDSNGGISEVLEEVVGLTGSKCKLSKKIQRASTDGTVITSTNAYQIFADPNLDLKQNDIITIKRLNYTYKLKCSKIFVYLDSHIEITCEEKEENNG